MDLADRLELVRRGTQEIVTEAELEELLRAEAHPRAYVGIEPSGYLHIGQGLLIGRKVREMVEAGIDFTLLLADWHARINDKLGGDLESIRACGRYLQDCFTALGLPPSRVRYLYASDLVGRGDYWADVIRVLKATTLARIRRALTIMGRREDEAELDASKLIYPAMQVTDIHALDLDIAYGGMDQRHAHMLYRDLWPRLGWKRVVAVHTPLLPGLRAGAAKMDLQEAKMSKSRPGGAILVHDPPEEIQRKLGRAYCPPGEAEGNPVLELARLVLFPSFPRLRVERSQEHGGDIEVGGFRELRELYVQGKLHPLDLKATVARYLADLLKPVRDYLASRPENLQALRSALGG